MIAFLEVILQVHFMVLYVTHWKGVDRLIQLL